MIAMLVTGLGRSKRSGAGRDADASVPRPGGSGISMSRRAGEAGFTLIELMIVIAVIAILLSVAFAQYRRTRTAADEAVVVATLRTIGRAQAQFALTCGNQKFSSSLAGLGQPVPTTGVAFLSPDLTSGDLVEKAGYQLNFVAKPIQDAPPACNGATVAEGYAVTADPLGPELTGRVFFAINADRVVYEDEAQTFTGNMPESGAPGHGSEVK
jgi:prepilin-type N-terminal cleavage/methylation domain-containing protein